MSLTLIQQNARMIKNASLLYGEALQTNNKKEIDNIRQYVLTISLNIRKLIQKEKQNVI